MANYQFYPVTLEGKIHSIRFDQEAIHWLTEDDGVLVVEVAYQALENGLLHPDDMERVNGIEDEVCAYLSALEVVHIASITGNGCVDHFFVGKDLASARTQLLNDYGDLLTAVVHKGQAYTYYHEVIYPNIYHQHIIRNQSICMKLIDEGDDLNASREVEVYTAFEKLDDAENFSTYVNDLSQKSTTSLMDDNRILVTLVVEAAPKIQRMNELTTAMIDLSKKYNGELLGWSTFVIT